MPAVFGRNFEITLKTRFSFRARCTRVYCAIRGDAEMDNNFTPFFLQNPRMVHVQTIVSLMYV